MCDSVFAIGQRGSYHFESPSKWANNGLPDALQALFDAGSVASVYSMTLGKGDSFFVAYKGNDGSDHLHSADLPATLREWVYEKSGGAYQRSFPRIRITLGPDNHSYFAHDGTNYKWSGLPQGLNDALGKRKKAGGGWTDAPRLVTLGACDSYVLVTAANAANWNLGGYRSLDTLLKFFNEKENGGSMKAVQNMYLNPYRIENYILQSTNGYTCCECMPPHVTDVFESIKTAIVSDMAEIKKKEAERRAAELEMQLQAARLRQQQQAQVAQLEESVRLLRLQNEQRQRQQAYFLDAYSAMLNMSVANTYANFNMFNTW